jgi:hypothetical protein
MEEGMSRAELVFPSMIFVAVAGFMAGGYALGEYSSSVIAFPLGAATFTCALCVLEIARVLARQPAAPATAASEDADAPAPISATGLFWMFVLPVFLYALGFVAGPALYLLACLRATGFSWVLAISVAAASVAMTWGFFFYVMGVLLPLLPLWWP